MRKKKELPAQNQPIYIWILTEDHEIQKLPPVTEYSIYQLARQDRVIMRVNGAICYTNTKSFDKLYNNRYYSFKDDDKAAKTAIIKAYERKMKVALATYNRTKEIYEKIQACI